MPIALKTVIEQRIEAVRDLFPAWVNSLTIRWAPSEDDIATAQPQYEYRAMTVTLHPPFLEDKDWQSSLIHEICHGMVRPYVQLVDKMVEKFAVDGVKEFLLDMLAAKEEEICEDLAIFVEKIRKNADV